MAPHLHRPSNHVILHRVIPKSPGWDTGYTESILAAHVEKKILHFLYPNSIVGDQKEEFSFNQVVISDVIGWTRT
ncbi:hypothetical protein MKW98_013007 [Papaver atlanticum]|uniref:Uncharacterized protein n=1 Tax=Papaver atlanticum TaxID=357466 RepID=A0AAD4SJ10_9MAGN|nr:hypothetical protein MKW98_013007 [Papaver atlanticum]